MKGISVKGTGIICAIGNNCARVLDSLQNGRSGIARMQYLDSAHTELPVGEVKMSNAQMKRMLNIDEAKPVSRTSLMGAIAVKEAIAQAGEDTLKGKRVTLISGTTVGIMDLTEKLPCNIADNECGRSTLEIAELSGIPQAQCCTISTACSSALNAIITGAEMLKRDETDIVIAGGSEALSRFHLNGFNTLMILDSERCRPFDKSRSGLNLGEGAAYVVMEKSTDGLAFIQGYANRCDAFHQTASSENGEGAFLAMTGALQMASLTPDDIQYVNAHGTGTPNNDASESNALKRVFKSRMPEVSSTKAFTGHTTSASGSIETVICILALRNSFTPASLGFNTAFDNGIVPTDGRTEVKIENAMCNSFGFGGNDSSIVIGLQASESASPLQKVGVRELCRESINSSDGLKDLKNYLSPMEMRRMGAMMKACHLSALKALDRAGINTPDAIISSTSHGMLETSTLFLNDIASGGERQLKPTLFMQSTHNTVSSALAIKTACHGYNTTYSQCDESLDWALRDARRLIQTLQVRNVLVIDFDEKLENSRSSSLNVQSIILTADE